MPDKINVVMKGEFGAIEGEGRILRWRGSSADLDRDGEVIPLEGWELDNYRRNPVVLFGHDYHSLPVARARSVESTAFGLDFEIEFPSAEQAGEHFKTTDSVYRLAKSGFLKAASVGFRPLEQPKFQNGDGIKEPELVWGRRELLELSIVPVPSNPEALRRGLEAEADKTSVANFLARVIRDATESGAHVKWAEEVDEIIRPHVKAPEPTEEPTQTIVVVDRQDPAIPPDLSHKIDKLISTLSTSQPNPGRPVTGVPAPGTSTDEWVAEVLKTKQAIAQRMKG